MRQWSVLTAVTVLAVLAAGWFLLVSPKRSSAAALRADAAAQAHANDTLRAQLAALTLQARNLPQQRARLAALQQKIPTKAELPAMIRRLQAAADQSGVTVLSSIQPGVPTVVAPGAAAAVPAPTAGTPGAAPVPNGAGAGGGQLLAIPLTLQVTGGFFQLEQFLGALEDLPRSFLVGQLSVTPNAAGGGTSATRATTTTGTTSATAGVSGAASTGSLAASITGRVFLTTAQPTVSTRPAPSAAAGG